jgi:hypothetical protein
MSGGVHAATPVEDGLTHALWVLAASAIVALVARLALRASNALARVTVAADGSLLTPGGAAVAVLEELLQELQQFCAGHGLGGFVFGQALSGRPSSAQKARSCPALNELPNSDRAIDAYADALEEFERHRTGRRLSYGTRTSRTPSFPRINEDPVAETEHAILQSALDGERSPARRLEGESRREPLRGPPQCVVLGDAAVGKSTVIGALEAHAEERGVQVRFVKGVPSRVDDEVGVVLVVWSPSCAGAPSSPLIPSSASGSSIGDDQPTGESAAEPPASAFACGGTLEPEAAAPPAAESLAAYVERHMRLLQQASEPLRLPGTGVRNHKPWRPPKTTLVLANMSDAHPCPHAEFEALSPEHIFLAGSAALGTNMHNLWRLVEKCAKPRQQAEPVAGGDDDAASLGLDSPTPRCCHDSLDAPPQRRQARRRREREIAAA